MRFRFFGRFNGPLILACLCLGGFLAVTAVAAETPIPPVPDRWVTDSAQFLSAGVQRSLDRQLEEYERQTHHQVIVWIGQTTGDAPIEDWAVKAFAKWKVGRKGMDDGLVLFIMAQDRRLRIEVGYGLEGNVPDVIASRIINEVLVPRIRDGNRDGAVTEGVSAILAAIEGRPFSVAVQDTRGSGRRGSQPLTLGQILLFLIAGVVFLFILLTNPSLAVYLLASILSSNSRSRRSGGDWGGGGGGGFSGGGGSSGGGGASGSW